MSDLTEIELLLDQTVTALDEIASAITGGKKGADDKVVAAISEIATALSKRQPLDLSPIIRELRALREVPAFQVMPAPVQFLPSPDAVYEVEVHPTVNGRQSMTIRKSTTK